MNYIELINSFWKLNKEQSFTSYETQLYFKLLDTCNSLRWKNPFNQSNTYICGEIGISEPKLIGVRNKLKQYGLIDFKSGKQKREKTVYHILGLTAFSLNGNLNNSLNGSLNDSLNGENRLDNSKQKQEETKTNQVNPLAGETNNSAATSEEQATEPAAANGKKEKSCAKKESSKKVNGEKVNGEKVKSKMVKSEEEDNPDVSLNLPFHSPQFTQAWQMLHAMPKWKKKPAHSLQVALNQLARYHETFATQQVERAIAAGWQGVVFASTDNDYQLWIQKQQRTNETEPSRFSIGYQSYGQSTI